MIEYGYEVISCSRLDKEFVDSIDVKNFKNRKAKLVIEVDNTKYIDSKALAYLLQFRIKHDFYAAISVLGPYKEDIKDYETTKDKKFFNTLYEIDELYNIIDSFEKIESKINPNWNEYEKLIYIIEVLVKNIMYDPEYYLMHKKGLEIPKINGDQDQADYLDRTLRGVLTKKTVCAGYATIFKELCNRNGIKCKYVSGGSYTTENEFKGRHAWNLIKINGIIYPVDITKKNTKYRNGDFKNMEDICCDIEQFIITHRPNNEENNIGLTKLDEKIVEEAKKKTCMKKGYSKFSYIIQRSDKTEFLISQIGLYKGLHRYLYTEIEKDGSFNNPALFFSETNFIEEKYAHTFERSAHFPEFKRAFADVLFSKENIADSISKTTKYIGACELGNGKYVQNCSEIQKNEHKTKAFSMDNIKSKKREDGSLITIVQFDKNDINNLKYEYYVYVITQDHGVLEYNIFSNENYFELNPKIVINDILSDKNLNESISNGGIMPK